MSHSIKFSFTSIHVRVTRNPHPSPAREGGGGTLEPRCRGPGWSRSTAISVELIVKLGCDPGWSHAEGTGSSWSRCQVVRRKLAIFGGEKDAVRALMQTCMSRENEVSSFRGLIIQTFHGHWGANTTHLHFIMWSRRHMIKF